MIEKNIIINYRKREQKTKHTTNKIRQKRIHGDTKQIFNNALH